MPAYDSQNATHNYITPSNGNIRLLNDATKMHHYLAPGNYGNTVYTLTSSGSAANRRTLSLLNGNDTHPAALPDDQQADINLDLSGANYWTVSRISNLETTRDTATTFQNQSTHNLFDRVFYRAPNRLGILLRTGSNNNTIQRSVLSDQTVAGRRGDGVAISFLGVTDLADAYVYDTHILDCDIRNWNDGIQPVKMGNVALYNGTIIDGNNIWIDSSLYSDSKGNPDPNGFYATAENAIDIKGGSADPANPMIVSNNHIWGLRKTATWAQPDSNGEALTTHYGIPNLIIRGNVIFDSARTINYADTYDSLIENNILVQTEANHSWNYNTVFFSSRNVTVRKNLIKGPGTWTSMSGSTGIVFDSNAFISVGSPSISSTSYSGLNNFFFNFTPFGSGAKFFSSESAAELVDLTFVYDRYTASPKIKTVPGVVPNANSPLK